MSEPQTQSTLHEFLSSLRDGAVVTLEGYGRVETGRVWSGGRVFLPKDGEVNLSGVERAHCGSRHWSRSGVQAR